MGRNIGGAYFDGPHRLIDQVVPPHTGAVCVIDCQRHDRSHEDIDVVNAKPRAPGSQVGSHRQRQGWQEACRGTLHVYYRFYRAALGNTERERAALTDRIKTELT
jgi:hypothetical protein